MDLLGRDEGAMNAVIGTMLVVAVAVVLVAGLFVFANGFHSAVESDTYLYGLVTDEGDQAADRWAIRLQSVNAPALPSDFDWALTTPRNGTLVARPPTVFAGSFDVFWELGGSAGTGVHFDNGSTVQTAGLGGFRLHVDDRDENGKLTAGDKIVYYFDGDGDQGHTAGRDEHLPTGTYGFDLLHRATQSISGSVLRDV